jgi:hypothetical protein
MRRVVPVVALLVSLITGVGCRTFPLVKSAEELAELPAHVTHIRARRLGDDAVPGLVRRDRLVTLNFASAYKAVNLKMTLAGFTRLADSAPSSLIDVRFHGSDEINDAWIEQIGRIKSLECVILYHCPSFDEGALRHLMALPKLKLLGLGGCEQVTDRSLALFAQSPSLVEVFAPWSGISESGAAAFNATHQRPVIDLDRTKYPSLDPAEQGISFDIFNWETW